jgi:hypothetical protein
VVVVAAVVSGCRGGGGDGGGGGGGGGSGGGGDGVRLCDGRWCVFVRNPMCKVVDVWEGVCVSCVVMVGVYWRQLSGLVPGALVVLVLAVMLMVSAREAVVVVV